MERPVACRARDLRFPLNWGPGSRSTAEILNSKEGRRPPSVSWNKKIVTLASTENGQKISPRAMHAIHPPHSRPGHLSLGYIKRRSQHRQSCGWPCLMMIIENQIESKSICLWIRGRTFPQEMPRHQPPSPSSPLLPHLPLFSFDNRPGMWLSLPIGFHTFGGALLDPPPRLYVVWELLS